MGGLKTNLCNLKGRIITINLEPEPKIIQINVLIYLKGIFLREFGWNVTLHDLETDLNDVDKTPSLIHKTLLTASTIYDLKYLAQVLNDENGSNWSCASLKRQVTCIPEHCELSIADGRYLQTLIPSRPADYEDRHFSFIDLFAGIGGLQKRIWCHRW